MTLYHLLFLISGFFAGVFVNDYACRVLSRDIKTLSLDNIFMCVLHGFIWTTVLYMNNYSYVGLLYCVASSALFCLAIVDWFSYEIPIECNILILGLGIIRLLMDIKQWPLYVIGMFLVSGIFFLILVLTKGRGMGGRDVKLMFAMGLLLGWKLILGVMIVGSLLASIIHIIIMKLYNKEHMLAFGPYLGAASIIMMCIGDKLVSLYVTYILG